MGRLYNRNNTDLIGKSVLAWYPQNARDLPWRRNKDPYRVWLSEIMLQQTRVEAVKGYYQRFLSALPTIEALANAPEEQLLKLWEGLGYYNRVRNLQKAAGQIVEIYGGRFPTSYEEILGLAGIGEYTAGAIGSICFDLPTPAVDGNVLRVWTRLFADDSSVDKASVKKRIREELAEIYEAFPEKRGMLTQGFMELGATVCIPKGAPDCEHCPLAEICLAKRQNRCLDFPVHDPKKQRRIEEKTVLVLQCKDKVAIRKRDKKGLLAGLWEFPNVDGKLDKQEASDLAGQFGSSPERLKMELTYTHIFSHVEWRMTAYYLACREMADEFTWVDTEQIEQEVAIPSAFRPFAKMLKDQKEA